MDLKDKVISFGLAGQLKELGILQNSLFYWISFRNESSPQEQRKNIHQEIIYYEEKEDYEEREYLKNKNFYSAFTSDELIDLLPSFVDTKRGEPYNNFGLEIDKRSAKNIQYIVKYICDIHGVDRYGSLVKVAFTNRKIYDENLSNALAKMLILLIEENLYVKREPIDTGEIL